METSTAHYHAESPTIQKSSRLTYWMEEWSRKREWEWNEEGEKKEGDGETTELVHM